MFLRLLSRKLSSSNLRPKVECIFHEETCTCCYVVSCPSTGHAVVIDSVLDYDLLNHRTSTSHIDKVLSYLKSTNLSPLYSIETHVHADHLTAAQLLKKAYPGIKSMIGSHVTVVQNTFAKALNLKTLDKTGKDFDELVHDNYKFTIGQLPARAMHTPGHTPACMVYVIGDAVFTGDTLFMPDFGTARCDFPGGSAELMYLSIQKIFELPDHFRVFVGHDYGTEIRKPAWESTILEEKTSNKQLNEKTTKEEFVAWRMARDLKLKLPRLIFQSLQVNLRNGIMPEPEENGVAYFRIPINLF